MLLDAKVALQLSGCGSAVVVTYTICLLTMRSLTDGGYMCELEACSSYVAVAAAGAAGCGAAGCRGCCAITWSKSSDLRKTISIFGF